MKRASAFQIKGKILLFPEVRTQNGTWMTIEPCLKLESEVEVSEVGNRVVEALSRSRLDYYDPHPRRSGFRIFLKPAGVRSYRSFAENASLVLIFEESTLLELVPTLNRGAKDGWVEISQKKIELTSPTSEELGTALNRAFELTE